MHIRRLLVLPALVAAISLGACEAGDDVEVEPVAEPVVEPVVAPAAAEVEVVPAAPVVTEIPGNGIDDDGDGVIDEAV